MNFKLILLDRDGVINRKIDKGYVNSKDQFELNDGILEFLDYLETQKMRTAIITNQQGLSKGVTNYSIFFEIQGAFAQICVDRKITPPQLFYCPHLENSCFCRKPLGGMLKAAMATFNAASIETLLVGDMPLDIKAAQTLGVRSVHLTLGQEDSLKCGCEATLHANSFDEISYFLGGVARNH